MHARSQSIVIQHALRVRSSAEMGAGASIEMDGEAKAMAEEMVFHIFQASLDDPAAVKAAPDADVPESLKASVAL